MQLIIDYQISIWLQLILFEYELSINNQFIINFQQLIINSLSIYDHFSISLSMDDQFSIN